MASKPVVNLTLQTFLRAELGFLGVVVYTLVQTPLFCGDPFRAGTSVLVTFLFLGFLTNWFTVDIFSNLKVGHFKETCFYSQSFTLLVCSRLHLELLQGL